MVLHRCLLVLQTSVLILFKDGLFRISMLFGGFLVGFSLCINVFLDDGYK